MLLHTLSLSSVPHSLVVSDGWFVTDYLKRNPSIRIYSTENTVFYGCDIAFILFNSMLFPKCSSIHWVRIWI